MDSDSNGAREAAVGPELLVMEGCNRPEADGRDTRLGVHYIGFNNFLGGTVTSVILDSYFSIE